MNTIFFSWSMVWSAGKKCGGLRLECSEKYCEICTWENLTSLRVYAGSSFLGYMESMLMTCSHPNDLLHGRRKLSLLIFLEIILSIPFFLNINVKNRTKLPDSLAPTERGSLLRLKRRPDVPESSHHTGHFESNSIGSININLGPGDCIWFAIPAEYSQSFAEMLNRQRRTKKSAAFSQTWWPNEEECIKQRIVVQKFVQKPEQLVYVCIGTYHSVQSEGYTANVSWNVIQPSFHQLAVAAIMNDHYLAHANYSIVPIY
ncbi:hypothetical protein B9Z55_021496 [Caenorhabditis nigoni]|uniref:JmjC domain-containing protein n=1 Tax=Caenorhabditis nigoni TaxID=1611254 RepID=A0A2G5TS65_9PELO|nr:hypothetical protein B9Z55_021496 [Caenorhabditis nigoni]